MRNAKVFHHAGVFPRLLDRVDVIFNVSMMVHFPLINGLVFGKGFRLFANNEVMPSVYPNIIERHFFDYDAAICVFRVQSGEFL